MNNPEIPVGTTVHINLEDIKWEASGDLISRSALKKAIKSYADDQYAENEYLGECAIMNIIDNAPTVEYTFEEAFQKTVCEHKLYCPDKRPKGEWKDDITCPFCNHTYDWDYNFCPNCGADLRGDTK